jgi:hypothetical protein
MVCYAFFFSRIGFCKLNIFPTIDDVWDEDSAYLELLANEVNKIIYFYLLIPFSLPV